MLIAYTNLTIGTNVYVTDEENDWTIYKGFVLGLQCKGDTEYVQTKYIPADLVKWHSNLKHVIQLQCTGGDFEYTCDAYAILNMSSKKATFLGMHLETFTAPKMFLYGIK